MTGRPTVGVLALQGDVREHLVVLDEVGARGRPVRRERELDEVDGIVLPGGESTTMDKLLRAFDLRDPLRERLAAGLPAYGSCAGMILLADEVVDGAAGQQTLGGIPMTVRRNAFGRQVESFEADLDVAGLDMAGDVAGPDDAPLRAAFIRAPWVEDLADEVEVLARVPEHGTPPAAAGRIVAVRHGALLATAFHPEITGDPRVHRAFVRLVTSRS